MYPETCQRFNNTEYNFCIPPKISCDDYVPSGLLTECGQEWNCNTICNGSPYFVPIPDKIMLQTRIKSSETPVVQIRDKNNGVISGNPVSYSNIIKDTFFYQTFEIDPALVTEDCFKIHITIGATTVCSQWFKKTSCKDSVSFESTQKGKDCLGQKYTGTGFSNKIYLEGDFKYYGGSVDEEGVPKEIYRFTPSTKIAPFMMQYLLNVILSGTKIMVNGKEYGLEGSGNLTPLKSGMFWPVLEFSRSCNGEKGGECNN